MTPKVGERYFSQVCDTQVIVVAVPGVEIDLQCGGEPMIARPPESQREIHPGLDGGALLGKRYADGGLELLVVKSGRGTLAVGAAILPLLQPRVLPSSD